MSPAGPPAGATWPPDRPVFVTGGASGIGRALVQLLRHEGVAVGALDRDEGALRTLAQESGPGTLATEAVSVADGPAMEAAFDRLTQHLGVPWGVVACAGIVRDRTLLKLTDDEWRSVLEVNLTGTFFAFRAGAARMRERQGGRLVAVSSIVGLRGGFGQANYAASKAGVLGLVKSAARELGKFGITVNAIAPGYVRTPMTAAYGSTLEEASRQMSPLGRVAEPEEVARVLRFLLSPDAGHLTGVVLRVDGGQAL